MNDEITLRDWLRKDAPVTVRISADHTSLLLSGREEPASAWPDFEILLEVDEGRPVLRVYLSEDVPSINIDLFERKDKVCPICGEAWIVHNDDGSCISD